jgi:hypothetical protein
MKGKMLKKVTLIILCLFSNLLYAGELLGQFDDWRVFKKRSNNKDYCLVIGHSDYTNGFPGFRDAPHLLFSKTKNSNFTLSLYTGIALDNKAPLQLFVGNRSFLLQPYRDFFGYSYRKEEDRSILDLFLQDKAIIEIRLVARDGSVAHDYYSNKGLKSALALAECK